jgi:hypothetical protein
MCRAIDKIDRHETEVWRQIAKRILANTSNVHIRVVGAHPFIQTDTRGDEVKEADRSTETHIQQTRARV